ncbi:MAG TPA: hypothetical protein VGH38_19930 [Bryobacteraceae bacterium]
MRSILLAVLAGAAVTASMSLAQVPAGGPFICYSSAGTPMLVRAEGLAERVSDIVITCSGGSQWAGSLPMNLTVTLGDMPLDLFLPAPVPHYTPITSRVVWPASSGTEALVLIDDLASPAVVGTNLIQGVQSGMNQVTFYQVPIVWPPPGTTRTFRITNLRADARDLPGQSIHAAVSISGTTSVPIANPVAIVGVKAPGALFSLQTTSNAPVGGLSFQQSGGVNAALATSPQAPGGTVNYNLKFSEGFAQSFRKRNVATTKNAPTALGDQNQPGTEYNTESGFYNSTFPSTGGLNVAGLATEGTRLVARFRNVPPGVALYVTVNPLPATGAPAAVLTASDSSGAGPFTPLAATTTATAGGVAVGIAPVTITAGSGTAAWEILDSDPTAAESATFGLVVSYQSPQNGDASVTGGMGPLSTVTTGDAVSPVPRFADVSADSAGCADSLCLTVTPAAWSLSYQTGSAAPAPLAIQVGSSRAPVAFNASVNTTPAGWLSLSAGSGVAPGTLTINVNPASLAPATYLGTVVMSSAGQTFPPVSLTVILTVTTGPSGYRPLECTPTVAVPPVIRAEGLAELTGDVAFVCTGGTAGAVVNTTVDLQTDADGPEFTSRIVNGSSGTEAIWMDETSLPQTGAVNPVQGVLISPHLLRFPNVRIVATGNGTSTVSVHRITNVRVDARALRNSPAGEFVQVKLTPALAGITLITDITRVFNNPAQIGAFVQPGLTFSLWNSADAAVPSLSFPQAVGENAALVSSTKATGGNVNFRVSFTEPYGTAFKRRNIATTVSSPFALSPQNVPGTIYNSESGFFDSTLPADNGLSVAGLATQGTRLLARFTNIPPGVKLYATLNVLTASCMVCRSMAQLIATDASGAGSYSPVAGTTTASFNGTPMAVAPLVVAGGTATATWEVLDENPAMSEQFSFGIVTAYAAPVSGAAAVNGSFAPLSSNPNADSNAPVPRFGQTGNEKAAIVSPAPGSTLAGPSVTFTWTPGSNVDQYRLSAGTSPGGTEYFDGAPAGLSATVNGLPANGLTVYVRLGSLIQGSWQYSDYTYSAYHQAATAPSVAGLTPAAGSGANRVITVTYNAPGGFETLNVVNVLINTALDARQACYLAYSRPANALYIVADNGDASQLSGRVMDGTGTIGNSQCTVTLAGSSASGSGNTLTLSLSLSFAPSFAGNRVIYAAARDVLQGNSGWQTMGVHGVPPLPATYPNATGMSPSSGSASTQTISFTYQDQTIASNLQTVWALINTALDGRAACYVSYFRPGNLVFLTPDDGDGTHAVSMPLTGNGTLSNGQCTVSAQGASVQTAGNSLTLTLPVTFKPGFAGFKGVWLAAYTMNGQVSPWQALGAWAVPQ